MNSNRITIKIGDIIKWKRPEANKERLGKVTSIMRNPQYGHTYVCHDIGFSERVFGVIPAWVLEKVSV